MKVPVTIEFASPGLQPPVFICTDLSDPQWQPIEMESWTTDQGEYKFSATFHAEDGEYQYKFRLGPGDWWECDSTKPMVHDDANNTNNLVVVKPGVKSAIFGPESQEPLGKVDSVHQIPLMSHEDVQPAKDGKSHAPFETDTDTGLISPLMKHETFAPPSRESEAENDEKPEEPPLLGHESVAPSSQEQTHSPLFRHESMAIDNKQNDVMNQISPLLRGRNSSNSSSVPEEADPSDPSLEKFPTDHRGIIDHIDRTHHTLPADETSDDDEIVNKFSPGSAVVASPAMPSVQEDEGEEEELAKWQACNRVAAGQEDTAPDADIPEVRIFETCERPVAPITPPMTPKEPEGEEHKELVDQVLEEAVKAREQAKVLHQQVVATASHVHKKAISNAPTQSSLVNLATGLSAAVVFAGLAAAMWYLRAKSHEDIVV